MSVKILCIGDPHFKSNNKEETDLLRKEILKCIIENKPDIVVLMGDTLDNGKSINPATLYDATEFIYDMAKYTSVYVLIGNHDMINNQQFLTPVHPFTGIRHNDNIIIVWKTEQIVFKNNKFVLVPYVPPGRFQEALDTVNINMKEITAIFCHQEFKGAALTSNGTKVSMNGDDWDEENPLVISGHIHTYSKLRSNIIYVGSSRQVDFGDITKKSISLFTFEDSNMSYHEDRLELNLKIRRIKHINVFDAYKWNELDDNIIWKLYIDGDTPDVNRFLRSNQCTWLEKQGVVIFPGNLKDNISTSLNIKYDRDGIVSFKELLEESVNTNENQKRWLDHILKKYNY